VPAPVVSGMPRKLVKVAVALLLIALVWKVVLGDDAEELEEVDRID
jgi:hypothetical protein